MTTLTESPCCHFCQILTRENLALVFQTEYVTAYVVPDEHLRCQLWVVPHQHAAELLELAPEVAVDVTLAVALLDMAICNAIEADGLTVLPAANPQSGHFHLHLVPHQEGQKAWIH